MIAFIATCFLLMGFISGFTIGAVYAVGIVEHKNQKEANK